MAKKKRGLRKNYRHDDSVEWCNQNLRITTITKDKLRKLSARPLNLIGYKTTLSQEAEIAIGERYERIFDAEVQE